MFKNYFGNLVAKSYIKCEIKVQKSGKKLNLGNGNGLGMFWGEKLKIFQGISKIWLDIEEDLGWHGAFQWVQNKVVGKTKFTGILLSRPYAFQLSKKDYYYYIIAKQCLYNRNVYK